MFRTLMMGKQNSFKLSRTPEKPHRHRNTKKLFTCSLSSCPPSYTVVPWLFESRLDDEELDLKHIRKRRIQYKFYKYVRFGVFLFPIISPKPIFRTKYKMKRKSHQPVLQPAQYYAAESTIC